MLKIWHYTLLWALGLLALRGPVFGQEQPIRIVIPASELNPFDVAEGAPIRVRVVELDDNTTVNRLEQEAQKRFREGRYQEALDCLTQAYQISQKNELLYNMAVYSSQLEKWSDCVQFSEHYMAVTQANAKRDQAAKLKQTCAAHLSATPFEVSSQPRGARIYIDDRKNGYVGNTPCSKKLEPGSHQLWAELEGYLPVQQRIEIQKNKPYRLNLQLTPYGQQGYVFVDCSIKGAQLLVDGNPMALTPLEAPIALAGGSHQIAVERNGYRRVEQSVAVKQGETTTVDALMEKSEFSYSWRTPVGWTAVGLGVLSIGGGLLAWQAADDEYRDSDKFNRLANWERVGYCFGGLFLAGGAGLVIWEFLRDQIDEKDRNPDYRSGSQNQKVSSWQLLPGGVMYGAAF